MMSLLPSFRQSSTSAQPPKTYFTTRFRRLSLRNPLVVVVVARRRIGRSGESVGGVGSAVYREQLAHVHVCSPSNAGCESAVGRG